MTAHSARQPLDIEAIRPDRQPQPVLKEGMVWNQYPPDPKHLGDPLWYDTTGQDVIDQRKVFDMESTELQAIQIRQILHEHPSRGLSIMFKAAVKGQENVIRTLLAEGVKPYPRPDIGDDITLVPLQAAAYQGHLNCLKVLVEESQDDWDRVNAVDEFGGTPLMRAAWGRHPEIVAWLLEHGADPTRRQTPPPHTDALSFAAGGGNTDCAKLILDHATSGVLVTPLALAGAADSGSEDMLKLMLMRGHYPLQDETGTWQGEPLDETQVQAIEEALARAAYKGQVPALRLLFGYLARAEAVGDTNRVEKARLEILTSLEWGLLEVSVLAPDTVSTDLDYLWSLYRPATGQSVEGQDDYRSETVKSRMLDEAAWRSVEATKYIVEKLGADVNHFHGRNFVKPLYTAAAKNAVDVARYLLENAKSDIHLSGGRYANGPTPLCIAIIEGHKEMVKMLLEHGGPVNHVAEDVVPAIIEDPTKAINIVIIVIKGPTGPKVTVVLESNVKEVEEGDERVHKATEVKDIMVLEVSAADIPWINSLQYRREDDVLAVEDMAGREIKKLPPREKGEDLLDPHIDQLSRPELYFMRASPRRHGEDPGLENASEMVSTPHLYIKYRATPSEGTRDTGYGWLGSLLYPYQVALNWISPSSGIHR